MFKLLSILNSKKEEIFRLSMQKMDITSLNSEIFEKFLLYSSILAENRETDLKYISFSNLLLYSKNYNEYSLHLLLDVKIEKKEILIYFDQLKKAMNNVFEENSTANLMKHRDFRKKVVNILNLLINLDESSSFLNLDRKESQNYKIGLVGLSNAGKTSIKRRFFEKWSTQMINKIRATQYIEYTTNYQQFLDEKITIWDFGGQKAFRKQYKAKKNIYENIVVLIFVLDIQFEEGFVDAKEYLDSIWKNICELNEKPPKLAIFLHKYDLDKKLVLEEKFKSAMTIFNDYFEIANFHQTTIQNDSNIKAILKTLYLGLPQSILYKFFSKDIFTRINEYLIPIVQLWDSFETSNINIDYNLVMEELKKKSIHIGITSGYFIQKAWLDSLIDNTKMLDSINDIIIDQKDQEFIISIPLDILYPKWKKDELKNLIYEFYKGFLKGVSQSLNIQEPQKLPDDRKYKRWKIII